ncbi:T9SS sorting signal type C domain-containing protein [Flavobacterium sp. DGU38]|uniref:T9SS sorting signal type C domain-containing protein n=1 Tax=Flavobacterium calami TaxID=3139144 RepID=A0ABU9ITC5_9FLAO
MIQKLLLKDSLFFLKTAVLFFLFSVSKTFGQTSVTRIYTDWNGYFTSNSATSVVANQPNTENNLLAFDWGGKTYATGANNAALTAHSVAFENSRFRALKIQSLPYDSGSYYLQGSNIDGSLTNRVLTPALGGALSTPAELAFRLTDGINGLALGTGIANIKANTLAEFKVGTNNIQLGIIGDGIPDIIVSQVAQPNSIVDKFSFVNAAGVVIGNSVNVDFTSNSIPAVGTYRLDLFNTNNGAPASGFSANDTRDIRLLAFDLSAFGLTDATASQVDRFVVNFSGSSDCAFIAFNTNSLKTAELALVKKATLLGCGVGSQIQYTFEVTNTGEVPLTNIVVTDPMIGAIPGSPIASLAAGATTTLTANYTITASDVALGRVINSAKVTALDPSSNTVEDISGNSVADDIQTVTNLLTPPAVGTVKNITCNSLGTINLSDLPSTGTWTLERNPGGITSTGTGSTTTVSGLPVGTYSFRVTNSIGCKSPSTPNVSITSQTTNTWDGSAWSTGSVPTIDQNIVFTGNYPPAVDPNVDLNGCTCLVSGTTTKVTIKSGRTLTVTNWVNVATDGNLIFENNASLMQTTNAVNTGKIIYKRISQPMKNFDFSYWSSPVAGQTLFNLSPNTLWDKYFSYSGTGWQQITNGAGTMIAGIGYIIRTPKAGVWPAPHSETVVFPYSQNVQFIGVPNNGNIASSQSMTVGNFYLIGNPYPSALKANDFLFTNVNNHNVLNGTIYLWTHNTAIAQSGSKFIYVSDDYASFNGTGGTATTNGGNSAIPSGNIAAGQSFFASAKSNGNVEFNNSMRIGGNNNAQFFKQSETSPSGDLERHRLWLNMTNSGGAFKQILVGYVEGATNYYDNDFDGLSFDGNSFIDFYSVNAADNFVIQGRALPFADTDAVSLGYRSTIAGDFTIAIDQADGKLATQTVYLEDKQTGSISELTAGNYTFSTKPGTFNNRFVLKYSNKTLGTGEFQTEENQISVIAQNKTITINSLKENIDKIFIFDLSGRQLSKKEKVNNLQLTLQNLPFAQQVLLIKIVLENGYETTKKVIFK